MYGMIFMRKHKLLCHFLFLFLIFECLASVPFIFLKKSLAQLKILGWLDYWSYVP